MGRLLNDEAANPNCVPKLFNIESKAHIIFVAVKEIQPGDELRYSYGKDGNYPWRKQPEVNAML